MAWLIAAAIGLFAGLLGGLLGVGGSIIIIPGLLIYLSYTGDYEGQQQHRLQAAAMICNVFVAAPSVLAHYRAGAIMRPVVVRLTLAAMVAMELGVRASNSSAFARENGAYLAMILAGFMVYVVVYNAWRLAHKTDLEAGFDQARSPATWKVLGVGLVMGFAGGLLGIGGGAICVPLQQVVLKIPLRRAIANSATTIVCIAAYGALRKNATLPEHGIPITESLLLASTLIPTAILGSYLGGKLTHRLPRKVLRIVFVVFMATMACLTFARAWSAKPEVRRASEPVADVSSDVPYSRTTGLRARR